MCGDTSLITRHIIFVAEPDMEPIRDTSCGGTAWEREMNWDCKAILILEFDFELKQLTLILPPLSDLHMVYATQKLTSDMLERREPIRAQTRRQPTQFTVTHAGINQQKDTNTERKP